MNESLQLEVQVSPMGKKVSLLQCCTYQQTDIVAYMHVTQHLNHDIYTR